MPKREPAPPLSAVDVGVRDVQEPSPEIGAEGRGDGYSGWVQRPVRQGRETTDFRRFRTPKTPPVGVTNLFNDLWNILVDAVHFCLIFV